MANIWRGRYYVYLSDTAWQVLARPTPELRFIGVVACNGTAASLAVDGFGNYFAVNGRAVVPLVKRKVETALNAI